MTAIVTFKKTSARASALVALHGNLTSAQLAALPDDRDLLRSAVALAVAGMDAYFTDRFSESLVKFLKKRGPTDGLTKILSDAGLDTKAALEMITMKRPYRRVRTLVEAYLADYTTQKQRVIDELFKVYGVKDLCKHAQGIAKRRKLLTSVAAAVSRRHSIVHAGDLNAHDTPRPIDNKPASRYVKNIELFAVSCEAVLVNALKI